MGLGRQYPEEAGTREIGPDHPGNVLGKPLRPRTLGDEGRDGDRNRLAHPFGDGDAQGRTRLLGDRRCGLRPDERKGKGEGDEKALQDRRGRFRHHWIPILARSKVISISRQAS